MSDTSVQTAPAPAPAAPAEAAPPQPRPRAGKNPVVLVLEAVGSLKVTVALFVMSLVLVFFGTLAQIDGGIWNVMDKYFRSFYVFMPLQLLVQFGQIFFGLDKTLRVGGAIPFPGGFSLGVALTLNLIAAYSLRFPGYLKRWKSYAVMVPVIGAMCLAGYLSLMQWGQWGFLISVPVICAVAVLALVPIRKMVFFPGNRVGILTLHLGLILMLAGEFITAYGAIEGNMVIEKGETTNAVLHNRYHEIAFVRSKDEDTDAVTVIPGRLLKPGSKHSHADLPCDVTVIEWLPSSETREPKEGEANRATHGFGKTRLAVPVGEVAGAASEQSVDTPAAYVQLTGKDGADLGVWMLSVRLKEQQVEIGGVKYDLSLRFKHTYKPYSMRLEEFTFKRYEGTQTPKDFSSRVTLTDKEPGHETEREVLIRMNEPLRYRGDTFFQANWNKETEQGTVLQVVRNPAWQLPYWSCALVSLGMMLHFGLNLVNFLSREAGGPAGE